MSSLDKVICHIRAETVAECMAISQKSAEECALIRAEYSRTEQEEYWKCINVGTKEAEQRGEQLKGLAAEQSQKQLLATKQEMVNEAFTLAAKKLLELPKNKYAELFTKHGFGVDSSIDDIMEHYRRVLSQKIMSVLFD